VSTQASRLLRDLRQPPVRLAAEHGESVAAFVDVAEPDEPRLVSLLNIVKILIQGYEV
jgi:hypothetical protein